MSDAPAALSLDGAVAAIAAAREPEQAETPAPEAETEAPAEAVEPEETEAETQAEPEEAGQDEVDETAEIEPEETPAVEPPAFYTKAEKAAFADLPPEQQQAIARLATDGERRVNQIQQEIAAERKALAEREALFSNYEQEKRTLEDLLIAKLPPEPDLRLIDQNPAEYMRQKAHFDRAIGELQGIVAKRQEAEARQAAETEAQEAEHRKVQADELVKLIPELKGEKGRQVASDIAAYGRAQGYDDATLGIANANDLYILHKAMKWDRAQEAARAAKAKPIPKVSAPGVARSKAELGADKRRSVLQKLNSTGSVEDALAALQALRT
jgi:hypothetical protein